MTDSEDVLRAALEAAGLSLQAIPEEQRAMFTSLTEEEVTRLIRLRTGQPVGEPVAATGLAVEEAAANEEAAPTD